MQVTSAAAVRHERFSHHLRRARRRRLRAFARVVSAGLTTGVVAAAAFATLRLGEEARFHAPVVVRHVEVLGVAPPLPHGALLFEQRTVDGRGRAVPRATLHGTEIVFPAYVLPR